MSEETQHQNSVDQEILKARAEGVFQGQVLTKLDMVVSKINSMESRQAAHEAIVATKVGQETFKDLSNEVKSLQKMAYTAIGIVIVIQILIGVGISQL
jgi:thiosulfate reductase cytochrome b subunit